MADSVAETANSIVLSSTLTATNSTLNSPQFFEHACSNPYQRRVSETRVPYIEFELALLLDFLNVDILPALVMRG